MNIPIISVVEDLETGELQLVATSYGVQEPVGDRLRRGGDFPDIRYAHFDREEAERDCDLLQAYVNAAWSGKAPKAKGREEKEEVEAKAVDLSGAWWNE